MRPNVLLPSVGMLFLTSCTLAQPANGPFTVAETSDYRATSRYDDVITFIDRLVEQSTVVRKGELGTSVEGRSIPLVILADPPIETADDAAESDKLVVFAFGNIHAGEVCGKEALLMLARDIAATPDHPLLDDLIIVLAPIYNADGNERFSKDHRKGQVGPEEGVGQRANADSLDLNRDYVKLDSPEARALVRFYNKWDPSVIIDTHTTNGSHHQYTITYASPRNPAGDRAIIEWIRDTMLPDVSKRLEEDTGYKSFFYGNFRDDHKVWAMHLGYPPYPRYGTVYNGMRNRIAILCEAYAYASYKDRVLATRDFVRLCFTYAAESKDKIEGLIKDAKKSAIAAGKDPKPDDVVSIRSEPAAFKEKVTVLGFVEEERDGKRVSTDKPREYEVEFFGDTVSTLEVRRPFAYVLPDALPGVVENLQRHGIEVEITREDIELDLEVYTIDKVERAERQFEKHNTVKVTATPHGETRTVPAGSILVRTEQELGSLAVYLLEPESDDGLCTWNFFDEGLVEGAVL
ncbi:MAG: hypothetical protein IIB61_09590, partial [Planctomycetes bacterium]|nr:hypothetical protein [Planctomycetota bacterium]